MADTPIRTSRTRSVLTTSALLLIATPAAVSIWAGWVGLGELAGFGPVNLLPGIGAGFTINTAITLPVGVEAYSALAMGVWLGHMGSIAAQRFARVSALIALGIGMVGQVIYHLLSAAGAAFAPTPVVVGVACLPVAVLGSAGALVHMLTSPQPAEEAEPDTEPEPVADQAETEPVAERAEAGDGRVAEAAEQLLELVSRRPARNHHGGVVDLIAPATEPEPHPVTAADVVAASRAGS